MKIYCGSEYNSASTTTLVKSTRSTRHFFWYRKWPSEASNPHFPPLRGLKEGCALLGGRNPSLTWEAARQKRRFFTKTGSKVPFSQGLAGLHPLYGRAGPLTFKNLHGVTPGPGVREHGVSPDVLLLRRSMVLVGSRGVADDAQTIDLALRYVR